MINRSYSSIRTQSAEACFHLVTDFPCLRIFEPECSWLAFYVPEGTCFSVSGPKCPRFNISILASPCLSICVHVRLPMSVSILDWPCRGVSVPGCLWVSLDLTVLIVFGYLTTLHEYFLIVLIEHVATWLPLHEYFLIVLIEYVASWLPLHECFLTWLYLLSISFTRTLAWISFFYIRFALSALALALAELCIHFPRFVGWIACRCLQRTENKSNYVLSLYLSSLVPLTLVFFSPDPH